MKKIILVTGGQRSGKSTYAERLALEMAAGEQAVYMATLRIWDEEFAHRVQLHKERRVPQWINLEEEKYLGEPVCINMVWIKKRQPSKNAASFYGTPSMGMF